MYPYCFGAEPEERQVPVNAIVAPTHRAIIGQDVRLCDASTIDEVCAELVAAHPERRGELKVVRISEEVAAPVVSAPVVEEVAAGQMDHVGRERSERDRAAAIAAGFSVQKTVYTRGLRVMELGVENARASRVDHESKPLTRDAALELVRTIKAEEREDFAVNVRNVRMKNDGKIVNVAAPGFDGYGYFDARGWESFLQRSEIKGREYLATCPPRLRAINVNNWTGQVEGLTVPDAELKLRTRKHGDAREIYATVTPTYAAFDCDQVARALAIASPVDARGAVVYDGRRAKFECLFHSNVRPENYVAGEFFKAGVLVSTDDTGGGAIRVQACVWQNLCLNLIIIDQAEQETRIRHVGSVEKLAEKFSTAFNQALGKIDHFVSAWGYACAENVLSAYDEMLATTPARDVLAGIFNGVVERELVPVAGKRQDVVGKLLEMYELDTSSATRGAPLQRLVMDAKPNVSRAAVVNAFTRYAHEVNSDPWAEDAIQVAAGRLLTSKTALPFEAIA